MRRAEERSQMDDDEAFAWRLQRMEEAAFASARGGGGGGVAVGGGGGRGGGNVVDLSGGAAAAVAVAGGGAAAVAAPAAAAPPPAPPQPVVPVDTMEVGTHLADVFADLDDVYIHRVVDDEARRRPGFSRDELITLVAAIIQDPSRNHPRREVMRRKRARVADRAAKRREAEDWRALADLEPHALRTCLGIADRGAPMATMSAAYFDATFAELKRRFPFVPIGFIRFVMTGSTKKLPAASTVECRRFVRCANLIQSAAAQSQGGGGGRKKRKRKRGSAAASASLDSYKPLKRPRDEPSIMDDDADALDDPDGLAARRPTQLLRELTYWEHAADVEALRSSRETERAAQVEQHRSAGTLHECPICMDDEVLPAELVQCGAGHSFCRECVSTHAKVELGKGATSFACCFGKDVCAARFEVRTMRGLLPPLAYNALQRRMQAEEVQRALGGASSSAPASSSSSSSSSASSSSSSSSSSSDELVSCPFCDFACVMPKLVLIPARPHVYDITAEESPTGGKKGKGKRKKKRKEPATKVPPPPSYAGSSVFQCCMPSCSRATCRLCKRESHLPLRCSEVEGDDALEARRHVESAMTDALLRSCWKCSKSFFKVDGCVRGLFVLPPSSFVFGSRSSSSHSLAHRCNHMTCQCGAESCYLCDKKLSASTWRLHFVNENPVEGMTCKLYTNTVEDNATRVARAHKMARKEVGEALMIDPIHGKLKR